MVEIGHIGMDDQTGTLRKLKKLAKHQLKATILIEVNNVHNQYIDDTCVFSILGLMEPEEYTKREEEPDCGKIELYSVYAMIIFQDFLNKFSERFWLKENGKIIDVAWNICPLTLTTAIRLLDENAERLEEITKLAKSRKQFLALAAIA